MKFIPNQPTQCVDAWGNQMSFVEYMQRMWRYAEDRSSARRMENDMQQQIRMAQLRRSV